MNFKELFIQDKDGNFDKYQEDLLNKEFIL